MISQPPTATKPDRCLWRGSLLPLGREAAPKDGPAAQSSGSKLPRHTFVIPRLKTSLTCL
ncbi:hypothetical protein DCC84_32560 [Pseudomonas sp. SXM-1]|nr:hypothetical protein DCC84_32560 [Pseudomonas sp. SXM-1]